MPGSERRRPRRVPLDSASSIVGPGVTMATRATSVKAISVEIVPVVLAQSVRCASGGGVHS